MLRKVYPTVAGIIVIWLLVLGVSIVFLPGLSNTLQANLIWAFQILVVVIGIAATVVGIWSKVVSWQPEPEADPWAAPLPPPTFVPRKAELSMLKTALGIKVKWWKRTLSPDIIGISGMGGCGKTTLVKAFLRDKDVRRVFKDGFLLADLSHDSSFADIENQLLEWAQKLGVGDEIKEIKTAKLRSLRLRGYIRDKKILIILDNAWNDEIAKHLLAVRGPKCKAVVVSRHEELLIQLDAYSCIPIHCFSQSEAFELVEKIIRRSFDRDEKQEMLLVLERVGYLPLAFELLAKQRIQGHPWLMLLERIMSSKRGYLQECFNLSYDHLDSEKVRSHFRRLGILPASCIFGVNEALVVWGSTITYCEAASSLNELATVSLIERMESESCTHFSIHPLLRDHAIALLGEKERIQSLWAHANYHINLVKERTIENQVHLDQRTSIFPHITAILQRALRAHKNIDTALAYDRPGYCCQILCDLTVQMAEYWPRSSLFAEWEYWTKEAILVAKTDDQFANYLAILQINLSAIYLLKYSYLEARQAAYEGWLVAREIKESRLEAAALGNLGQAHLKQNDLEAAYDCFHHAKTFFEGQDADPMYPDILSGMGQILLAENEYETAFDMFDLSINHRLVYSHQLASDYSLLGFSAYKLGKMSLAFQYCQQAVCICFAKGSQYQLINYLENLTMVLSSIEKANLVVYLERMVEQIEERLEEQFQWFTEIQST